MNLKVIIEKPPRQVHSVWSKKYGSRKSSSIAKAAGGSKGKTYDEEGLFIFYFPLIMYVYHVRKPRHLWRG